MFFNHIAIIPIALFCSIFQQLILLQLSLYPISFILLTKKMVLHDL